MTQRQARIRRRGSRTCELQEQTIGDPTTRTRILDAARRLLAEGRGRRVSMGAIAEAAGVSRQALYLHFDDRAELLLATVAHVDASYPLTEWTQEVRQAPDALAALDRYVEVVADSSLRIIDVARPIDAGRLTDPDLEVAWQDRMEGRRAGCRQLVERLADEGRLAACWTVERATDHLWVQTSLRVWDDLCNERGWSRATYVETMQRTLRDTLVRPAVE